MDPVERVGRYEDLVQRFAAALRAARLYASSHPRLADSLSGLLEAIRQLQDADGSLLVGFVGGEIIADDRPLPRASATRGELVREMEGLGIHRLDFDRGVTVEELATLVRAIAEGRPQADVASNEGEEPVDFLSLPHLRAGRIPIDAGAGEWGTAAVAFRRVYRTSIDAARVAWESAATAEGPSLPAAREAVEALATAVDERGAAMLGLTSMQEHDNYTFTHMVNVAILTIAQARSMGVDGGALRDIGLAAFLHDLGKVRVPSELLNKTGKLSDHEFALIKRHPVDGASILRRTREVPLIAPLVAFEHHLRQDGTGYPERAVRRRLNLATVLCSIADVYDAMRSQRQYQQSFPADRILAILRRKDGGEFDQRLVARFVRLMGLYPPGSLVQLGSGEVAVVVDGNAPEPRRPLVRVLLNAEGKRLAQPEERRLWQLPPDEAASVIRGSVEPTDLEIDPLVHLAA